VLFLLTMYFWRGQSMSREEAVWALGAAAVGTLGARIFLRDAVELPVRRVRILGAGLAGREMAAVLRQHPGYRFCGYLDDLPPFASTGDSTVPPGDGGSLRESLDAELVVVAAGAPSAVTARWWLRRLEDGDVGMVSMPYLYELLTGRVPASLLLPGAERVGTILPPPALAPLKRFVDLLAASVLLVMAAPVMVGAAVLIRLTSPGPILYSQLRVGVRGRRFRLWKFRSMRLDAEQLTGPVWAAEDDPRVTPLGRILRKTRVDELPQLWNILRGEMSLTGPRPERPAFVERFSESIPGYRQRLAVRPGLTGWAQVMHHYGGCEADVVAKLQYDLYYIKHWSLLLDLRIWVRTIGTVLTGRGAR
jgi:exopolysaccharide biosynthesis polyprenyl glycosylphosphotransferase